jgi:hypothetical protein
LEAIDADEILLQIAEAPDDETNVELVKQFLLPSKTRRVQHDWKPSETNDILIEAINGLDLGWKADSCKLQKDHSKRPSHCDTMSLASKEQSKGKKLGEGDDF